ncbi:TPA: hypothetical protein ACX6RX_003194 [Photobacterium damselae]
MEIKEEQSMRRVSTTHPVTEDVTVKLAKNQVLTSKRYIYQRTMADKFSVLAAELLLICFILLVATNFID